METGSVGAGGEDSWLHSREGVERAAEAVRARIPWTPEVGVVLGSGLAAFAEGIENAQAIPFDAIPGFPLPTVPGHPGFLAAGKRCGVCVAALVGRFHLYEGHSAGAVGFPVRVLRALGARVLVVTNAAGGVNPAFEPGDLMLIADHWNLQPASPLRGRGPLLDVTRFVDLSEPYSRRLLAAAQEFARRERMPRVHTGVYCGVLGPAYETPAEVAMLRRFGADAVGMSTIPEVIAARHAGMEVLGVSAIANRAASSDGRRLSHEDVLRAVEGSTGRVIRLLDAVLPAMR